MSAILGISAFYHDSAAAILVDGELIAAAQEERFSRIKYDAGFPSQAIAFCLDQAGLDFSDLDHVAFYEKPFRKFERILESHLAAAPASFASFLRKMPDFLGTKLRVAREIQKALKGRYKKRILFPSHHFSHAASAFYPSPFEQAAILTVDGVGEWATTSVAMGEENRIQMRKEIQFPNSLGLLYATFTAFCGFRVNGGEGKLMGLAPFGKPVYTDAILEKMIRVFDDGSFQLNLEYFDFLRGDRMYSRQFEQLFDGRARQPQLELSEREMNLAASIQKVTEMILLRLVRFAASETGSQNLCLAGGVALNCVANGIIQREKIFENLWIQPAAGDAGAAIGAAFAAWHQALDKRRVPKTFAMKGALLGPQYSTDEIELELQESGLSFDSFESDDKLFAILAEKIDNGKTIGWFQGPMEFGPRALGNRSMLADPRSASMKDHLNLHVKYREDFRPFAPATTLEAFESYFGEATDSKLNHPDDPAFYMLTATSVKNDSSAIDGKNRSATHAIPAVTHLDQSARAQVVSQKSNSRFHGLLKAVQGVTGCPVLINTSLNTGKEPIACSPRDAIRCFLESGLDLLVLDRVIVSRPDDERSIPQADQSNRKPRSTNTDGSVRISTLGLTLGMLIVCSILTWRFNGTWQSLLVAAGTIGCFAIALLLVPDWARPIVRIVENVQKWTTSGLFVISLTLVYGLMIIPIGILRRLAGRDRIVKATDPNQQSAWQSSENELPESFLNQY